MDTEFSAAFTGQLEAMLDGMTFVKRSTGLPAPVEIFESMVPRMTPAQTEGDDPPFVRWSLFEGEFVDRGLSSFRVVIDAGIYTPGTIVEGSRDILRLTRRLGQLASASLPPYKIKAPVTFRLGHPDNNYEGVQPHPYHYSRLLLDYVYPGENRPTCRRF